MDSCCKEKFISIIIPVYNSHMFLDQCMNSLINQDISDKDYEIIFIDDGSTDDSGIILDNYAEKYSNVIVHHKANSGVSAARNAGIKLAQGKYVWFIDADDFIAPNILKPLKDFAEAHESDRIKLASYAFDGELLEQVKNSCNSVELKPNMPYKDVMATRTLYKRDYLSRNNILFLEGVHYGEDGVFNYQTLIHNPKTDDSGVLSYFYRRHDSAATSAPQKERFKKSLEGSKKVFDVLVRDYNNRICLSQTRRMLLYWIYCILNHYSVLGLDYFDENFIWEYELDNIPFSDFELRRLNKVLHIISKHRNYKKLTKLTENKAKKDKRANNIQAKKKLISGYIKHPKRLLNRILGR